MIGKEEKEKLATKYLEMGKKLYELEDYRDSKRYLQKAVHIYEGLEDYANQAEALIALGRVYYADGSEELSIDYFLHALAVANENNLMFQIANIYNSIGSRFLLLHEIEKAIDYFEKSEDALNDKRAAIDKRYEKLKIAVQINLAKAFCENQTLDRAVKYLANVRKAVGDDKTNFYYFTTLLVECKVSLAKGNEDYVRMHIDELIEGIARNKKPSEFVKNIYELCELLEGIKDEAHYKWVVLAFETYMKMHDTPYNNMVNAHIWAKYYKFIGDDTNYQLMCVKHMVAYEKQVKINQKNRAASIDMRIELQGRDYHRFFEKYIANMREEEEIENGFRNAMDKDEWLMNLQQRTQYMSELYVDNENLIERYITPVLMDEVEMDDELASELFKGIWSIYKMGKSELRIGVELALKLEPYFEKYGYAEEHIRTLVIILNAYMGLNREFYYSKCEPFFGKIKAYRDYFKETKEKETRNLLLKTFFDIDVYEAGHKGTSIEDLLGFIETNLDYINEYEQNNVISLKKQQIDYLKDRYIQDMISANLVYCTEIDVRKNGYKKCLELIDGLYSSELDKYGNEYLVNDRIYSSRIRLLYLSGQISKEECYELYKKYYSYYMVEGNSAGDSLMPLQEQRMFHLMLYCVPEILELAEYEKDYEFCDSMKSDYLSYIKAIPKSEFGNAVGRVICSSFSKVMMYIDDVVEAVDVMMAVLVERDINLSIHSQMVSEIARLIVEMIYRQDCKILIGNLGIMDEQDAMDCWPEVMEFVENSAMIHDIGKIDVSNITKKQTRKLSDLEYDNVKRHPEFGAFIVKDSECIRPYLPIILGHHKNWDDSKGYPKNYHYLDNANPILVNIIQMADNLDAATDRISRAYKMTKTSDDVLREFEEGKGTRYNPKLVKMMLSDEKFKEELAELTTDGRNDICFNIFSSYLMQEK